ncbi:NAD(P)/FAD-dependent oxidoreductase [Mycolicibacterium sp.]|uniref:NAD(P)/FAD-dependent oxidoreductase n=1 Tax=Mycolicibacterium sp. TaxID=2320850 RepID=UPI003D0B4D88
MNKGAPLQETDDEQYSITERSYDAVVIGGGIAGASLAYELAADRRVTLVEAEGALGYHATGRSATMFLESYGGPDVRALTIGGRAFLEQPPEGFSRPLMTPRPFIQFAVPGRGERLRELYVELGGSKSALELIDAAQIRSACPYACPEFFADVALCEHHSQELDANALLQGFIAGFRARGGTVLKNAQVTGLRRVQELWRVDTVRGPLSAALVVNAAGAWADEVAQVAGLVPLGLTPRRRTAFTIDSEGFSATDGEPGPLLYDIDETFYMKPEGAQLLCSPADRTPCEPYDAKPDDLEIARALELIRAATTLQARSVRTSWAGLRTFSPDGNLVVGADPRIDGFFWAAGQGGYGIQTAPSVARMAAAMIRDEAIPADLVELGVSAERLSPVRFHS